MPIHDWSRVDPGAIFLGPETYVPAPLETTYQATWAKCPEPVREAVQASA